MGVEIPDGYGQATLRFACQGVIDPMVVTFGFAGADADSGPAAVAAQAQQIFDLLTSSSAKFLHAGNFSTEYTFLGVDVQAYNAGEATTGVSSSAPLVGTLTSPSLPPNCAVLVKKNTGLGGRRGRGRMYWPPMFFAESGYAANGVLTGFVLTGTQTRLTLFLTDLTTAGMAMVVHHGHAPGEFGELPPPSVVTSLSVQPLLATQRRRMR